MEQASALTDRIVSARQAENLGDRLAGHVYAEAAADLHKFCATNRLTLKDAERAIFVCRLVADVAADEMESLQRTGNGNGWVRLNTPFRMVRRGWGG